LSKKASHIVESQITQQVLAQFQQLAMAFCRSLSFPVPVDFFHQPVSQRISRVTGFSLSMDVDILFHFFPPG